MQPNNATTYNWAPNDRVVAAAGKYGLRGLAHVCYTPQWTRLAGCTDERCAPADPAAFATFSGAIAQRYPQILKYEIWNEPNTRCCPAPTPLALRRYSTRRTR